MSYLEELTPPEDLPAETLAIAEKAQKLRNSNARMIGECEQLGHPVEVGTAQVHHLMMSLLHLGVITEHQLYEISLDWEETLRPQAQNALQTARALNAEQLRAFHNQAQGKTAGGLIVPGRSGRSGG